MSTILLMINDKKNLDELAKLLALDDHKTIIAERGLGVKGYLNDNPDVIVIDAVFGGGMIEETKRALPAKPIVCALPGYDARLAVEMLKSGAFDCICPPYRRGSVMPVIDHAVKKFGFSKGAAEAKKFSWRLYRNFIYSGAAAFLLLAAAVFALLPGKPSRLELPYNDPTSIIFDAGTLWISNWYTQSIYRYNTADDKLELKKTYYFSDFGPLALAKFDNYVWSVGSDHILRQHMLNENLDAVRMYKLTGYSPSGIAFVGNNLWICDSSTKRLYQFLLSNGLVQVNYFETGLQSPVGLSWDGENIWTADAATHKLYEFRQRMDTIELVKIYRIPKKGSGTLAGLCVAGKTVMFIYADIPSYIAKYRIRELKAEL
jgi:hypothetical protein